MIIGKYDKCRVPICITAAKARALVQMQYLFSLPDHDWIVSEKHKLIPSVYSGPIAKKKDFDQRVLCHIQEKLL